MCVNCIFKLSMMMDSEQFDDVFSQSYSGDAYLDEEDDEELVDRTLISKGIVVLYRNSRYKKKIKLIVDAGMVIDGEDFNVDKFIRKLEKRIKKYFNPHYQLDDFVLSGLTLISAIDVGGREKVAAYLKVIRRIGRVKGFSPVVYDCFDKGTSYCLEGNSNGIEFLLYDAEQMILNQQGDAVEHSIQVKSLAQKHKGILRAEVRLTKHKAIRSYTNASSTTKQITELSNYRKDIFLDVFTRIIPFGDFHKKDKAAEIVRKAVPDYNMRRKMLRLLALIPEKKSLHLAQKAMNCRNIDKIMEEFVKINLSPVTISKRQNIQHLLDFYEYLF